MISASYAAPPQPLTVKFLLSPSAIGIVSGNVVLADCNSLKQVIGGVIDKITPSAKLPWIVPSGITCVQSGVTWKGMGGGGFCPTSLNPTGRATVTIEIVSGQFTCTCSGGACQ